MKPLSFQDLGSGPPVVLLHAFPLSATMWQGNAAALAKAGYRAICPDFPGFGGSSEFNSTSSMDSMAEAVSELLRGLGIEKAAFTGLSMGGYVLFSILRRRPGLVSCFALCDTTARADTEEKKAGRAELVERLEKEGAQALVDVMLSNLLSRHTLENNTGLVEDLRRRFLECDPKAAAAALRGMAARPDSLEVIANAEVPSVFIFGEDDKATDLESAREMKNSSHGAKLAVIPNAGHYSNLESPEEFDKHLISFLNTQAINY